MFYLVKRSNDNDLQFISSYGEGLNNVGKVEYINNTNLPIISNVELFQSKTIEGLRDFLYFIIHKLNKDNLNAYSQIKNNLAEYKIFCSNTNNVYDLDLDQAIVDDSVIQFSSIKEGYYPIYVIRGKEELTIKTLMNLRNNNVHKDRDILVSKGVISDKFKMSDLVLDIAYPQRFDTLSKKYVSFTHNYIFLKIATIFNNDLYSPVEIFNLVLTPWIKQVSGVIGWCGLQLEIPGKKIQEFEKNGRSVIRFLKKYHIQPVKLKDYFAKPELQTLAKSHSKFSQILPPINVYDFSPDELVIYIYKTKNKTMQCKVRILKIKDSNIAEIQDLKTKTKIFCDMKSLRKIR